MWPNTTARLRHTRDSLLCKCAKMACPRPAPCESTKLVCIHMQLAARHVPNAVSRKVWVKIADNKTDLDKLQILGAAGGCDMCAPGLRNLHGSASHPPTTPMYQDTMPSLDLCRSQCLRAPCGHCTVTMMTDFLLPQCLKRG